MAVIRPEKAAKVAEIKELLTASKCTILVDFCGLTVAQDTAFRRKMREAGVKYGVVKNTMLRIAANEAGIEGLEPVLEKNTAIAVAPEDPVAVAKIICDFAKENNYTGNDFYLAVKLWQNFRRKKSSLQKCWAA